MFTRIMAMLKEYFKLSKEYREKYGEKKTR